MQKKYYPVRPIEQLTRTCWLTSMQMVAEFYEGHRPEGAFKEPQAKYHGANLEDLRSWPSVYTTYRFRPIDLAGPFPDGREGDSSVDVAARIDRTVHDPIAPLNAKELLYWLRSFGPLVVRTRDHVGQTHAVVFNGIELSAENKHVINTIDPAHCTQPRLIRDNRPMWPPLAVQWSYFYYAGLPGSLRSYQTNFFHATLRTARARFVKA